eukprot:superscaffoldBa00001700_g11679
MQPLDAATQLWFAFFVIVAGKEIDLVPGSPLVLTHKIKLVPSGSGFGSRPGSCGCEADFAALRERLERLEREVSSLREKCGGAEGGCCTSKESKGAGCSIKPKIDECPNECSDQGRCVDGKCVCFPGFSGLDCSDSNCPGNCNNNGKCVNGQCVCDPGFTGPKCLQRSCPDNCNNQGRCVNGNCNNKGRCVNGQCVCDDGFAGQDCSEKACPNNCSNRGKCVNGKCVCDVGFAGPDCAAKACPNNCNNKGRCVKGKCVCRRGFTGPDCSQCEEGMTGPNCDTVMSGVSQLSTKAITDTSVTLLWTPPPIQYDAYHITFTSQKESDQQITVQVEGSLTTFTQTGLAAGQEYTVSITGEINGRRGAKSSTEFTTLISGPTKLQIVKTTSTSAVVQWEQSQGEIDRYRMTVSPNDGAGRSQEMTFPPGRDSAHIQQLEAGHLYDIILVAEKGSSQSEPATTQTVPGNTLPKVTMAAVTTQVTPAPGQELGDRDKELNLERQVFDQQGRKEDGSEADSVKVRGVPGHNKDPSATVIAKTKPLVSRKDGAKLKLAERPVFSRKPNAPNFLRFNATRVVPGGRKVGPGTKTPLREKKAPFVAKKPKPGTPTVGDRTQEETALTMRDPSVEASSTERREDKNPPIMSWTDSGTNTEDLTVPVGSKNPPDVGTAVQGSNADPGSSEPTGAGQSHEKKSRSFQFEDLSPQTEYTVTLLGKGPGLLSRLHKLVISTGPEPPSNIIFSKVTENSLTVSWTKPKRPVSGFKVTYTHTKEGEPVSVSVDSSNSSLGLSQLSPGSSYEVNVISILGMDESDPVKDSVMTLPDPATNLQAVNITDTKALLLWRPALAAIDKYAIVYGSGKDAALRITVSGNAAEQQLSGLEESTTYTVTITSELGSLQSPAATTSFTTTSGSGKLRDLQASQVTPRTALLSWKSPSKPVGSYRLTYQTESQEMKEVIVDATVTEYNLTRLDPGSKYTVQLQAEGGEGSTISTDFTTGTMQFPFPSDCSQELMNGIRTSGVVEIFPQGKLGTPMKVYCDMETDGGGWTVFQRRKDGSVDFFRGWKDYVKGFGDLSGEFWMGLDSIHNLTTTTRMSLRVDLRDGHESVFAKYSTFEVAKRNYRLTVGGYSGTAGDSLSYHNSRIFSTKDRDSAPFITRCAMSYRGGWWYKNCHEANLNGLYGIDVKHQGVIWTTWKGKDFSIPFTEMKMRPAAFSPPTRG